jgi:hypothetical protein
MPVGPGEAPASVADTLDSVRTYLAPGTPVVVVNDSDRPAVHSLCAGRSDVEVVGVAGRGSGALGGLAYVVGTGLRVARDRFDPDAVLRLDVDALVIGRGLEAQIGAAVAKDPTVGVFGSYRVDSRGRVRDFGPARSQLAQDLSWRSAVRHPRWARTVRVVFRRARAEGLESGEHPLGGAAVYTREALRRLSGARWLPPPAVGASVMGEDQLYAMAVRAVGLGIGDLATGGLPMALAWRGLPDDPAALIAGGKLLVHSVASFGGQDESAVRAQFRARRTAG